MAGGLAHALNNSLSCIVAACDLAQKTNDPEQLAEMLEHIRSAANQSAEFVRQASNLWKPGSSTSLTIDLIKVLHQHLAHYRHAAGDRTLKFESADDAVSVIGDPVLIHQAVLALIINAGEASSQSSIEIKCGEIPGLAPGSDEFFMPCGLTGLSVVYVEVKDTGIGMDSYTLRRAHNPFFSTKPGQKGLGLTMVCGVMSAHKGAIGIISSPGKGTTVRLYFKKQSSKF